MTHGKQFPDATPRRRTAGTAVCTAAVLLAVITACSAPEAQPSGTTEPGNSNPAPLPISSGTPSVAAFAPETARLKGLMESALKSAGAKPEQEALRSHLVSAGIPANTVEVSVSRTPTGLGVDAIEAAVSSGTECVVGEIRDGKAAVTVLPLLADGKCFVGDAR